jgi:tetratricopeptide (TPR) repeat protein
MAAGLLALGRLAESRAKAEAVVALAQEQDTDLRIDALELLVRIALARRDAVAARSHAAVIQEIAPGLPMVEYVNGRLLYDRKRYAEALGPFEQAVGLLADRSARQIVDLHFYTGDVLARLQRAGEAEREFLEELVLFPDSSRARVALANLYHATGRQEDAEQTLEDLLAFEPTPETYRLVARLSTAFGDLNRAAALRSEAAQSFASPDVSPTHPMQD